MKKKFLAITCLSALLSQVSMASVSLLGDWKGSGCETFNDGADQGIMHLNFGEADMHSYIEFFEYTISGSCKTSENRTAEYYKGSYKIIDSKIHSDGGIMQLLVKYHHIREPQNVSATFTRTTLSLCSASNECSQFQR